MRTTTTVLGCGLAALIAVAAPAAGQTRRPEPTPLPGSAAPEIRLDEATTLKAAVVEARMSAIVANFALLQRQAQDLQQEMTKLLEERKTLIEGAARQTRTDVKDPNEWAFDNKGQRYIRVRGTPQ